MSTQNKKQSDSETITTRYKIDVHNRISAVAEAITKKVEISCSLADIIHICVTKHLPELEKIWIKPESPHQDGVAKG